MNNLNSPRNRKKYKNTKQTHQQSGRPANQTLSQFLVLRLDLPPAPRASAKDVERPLLGNPSLPPMGASQVATTADVLFALSAIRLSSRQTFTSSTIILSVPSIIMSVMDPFVRPAILVLKANILKPWSVTTIDLNAVAFTLTVCNAARAMFSLKGTISNGMVESIVSATLVVLQLATIHPRLVDDDLRLDRHH